jgi:hypothetical protein
MRLQFIPSLFALTLSLAFAPAQAQVTIDTSNPDDWKIANGALTLDWSSNTGHVWSFHLNGYSNDLIDPAVVSNGHPSGLYMDNTGTNYGTGTTSASYHLNGYIDWWFTNASNSTNAFTWSQHFMLQPNDPTLYVYFVGQHSATDIAGNLGQVQYVFRIDPAQFTTYYEANAG